MNNDSLESRLLTAHTYTKALACLCALIAGLISLSSNAAPTAEAVALETRPTLDGDVLNDPAWKTTNINQFWQQRPVEGSPASQKTEVFIGYTDRALYIGVICYDTNPEGIIVSDSRRDADLEDTDSFTILIDSYLDQQNGFVFGTNPAGIEYDGQVTKEGSGAFGSGGGGFNLNWDTNWQVKTQTGDFGWSAEFEIPFKSLRYSSQTAQTWGFNFQRNIRRNNEVAFWSPIDRQYDLFRIVDAGRVTSIETPAQRNLKITPYALARRSSGNMIDGSSDQEVGFDMKYSVTPSLTLDVTYNTDFAQVEVDEFQINLDRFSLFLPEQRPFFLENAGQFAVGVPREVELFFSRRIGIASNGSQIPIKAGARLSGKVGSSTNVGFLHMQADAVAGAAGQTDFTVARVNQEFANRSSLGFLVVNKEADDLMNPGADDYNRTYAIDGRLGIGADGRLSGFLAKTDSPDLDGDDTAFQLQGDYSSEAWSFRGGVTQVGKNFNPEVGFLRRRDFTKVDLFALYRNRNSDWDSMHELRPHIAYRGYWGGDDFYETGFLHVDQHWEWKSGFEIHTGVNFLHEGVREPFALAPGKFVQDGEYDDEELQLVLITDQGAPLSMNVTSKIGGLFGGDRVQVSPKVRYRIGETFNASLAWTYNRLKLLNEPDAFTINVGSLRMTYSFSPKISLQALLQYNDSTEVLATNFRFAWLTSADAGFYLVYNETRDDDVGMFREKRKEWIVKYSHTLDVLN
ncbi:MAG: DUF5916 domain-containing protein [Gammaproteobacteria bacterium]